MRWLTTLALACFTAQTYVSGDDWSMGGRSASRNPVSPEKNAPTDWQVPTEGRKVRNIRWSANLGWHALGGPVVANGLIWVGTDNNEPLDPNIRGDGAVLACFRESDGKFLYQYLSPRKKEVSITEDWPRQSLSGSPLIEKDRLFFCNNRGEVICLDIDPLYKNRGKPKVAWKLDMVKELGVFPHKEMIPHFDCYGSPASYKDYIYVPTGNGLGEDAKTVVAPDAPGLLCLRKDSGKVVWKDNSPGKNILFGQHASPLVVEIDGKAQVIAPQSDGWVRSFDAETGKLLWKFDSNRKGVEWAFGKDAGQGTRTYVVSTPVCADGRIFIANGLEPECCWGNGRACCIDPNKRGDISSELDDGKGMGKPNPNSGLIWEFTMDGKDEKDRMHLSLGSIAVHDGFAIAADHEGYVHCLDAKTGKRFWTHDTKEQINGNPLVVASNIYIGSESKMWVFELQKTKKLLAKHEMERIIAAPPVFANGVLYVLTDGTLYAIGGKK